MCQKNYVSRKTGRTKIVVKNLEIYTLECQINKGRGGRVLIIVWAGTFPDILKGGGGVLINGNGQKIEKLSIYRKCKKTNMKTQKQNMNLTI